MPDGLRRIATPRDIYYKQSTNITKQKEQIDTADVALQWGAKTAAGVGHQDWHCTRLPKLA